MLNVAPLIQQALAPFAPPTEKLSWFPVEVRGAGIVTHVIECHADSRSDAYQKAISSMTADDIDRCCDGITLRILGDH